MDILSNLVMGFGIALSPWTLLLAVIGAFVGTIIGALPGLGPSNGVALLIPISFSMGLDAISALVLLTGHDAIVAVYTRDVAVAADGAVWVITDEDDGKLVRLAKR